MYGFHMKNIKLSHVERRQVLTTEILKGDGSEIAGAFHATRIIGMHVLRPK